MQFDKDMEWGLKFSPGLRTTLARRMRPYGGTSFFDLFTAAEGADGHCQPLAAGLRGERILDCSTTTSRCEQPGRETNVKRT